MQDLGKVIGAALVAACGSTATVTPAPVATPKPSAPELERVDVFGSKPLDRATLLARWGDALAGIVRSIGRGVAPERVTELEREIASSGTYAYLEVSTITYFDPRATYLTIDVVDAD